MAAVWSDSTRVSSDCNVLRISYTYNIQDNSKVPPGYPTSAVQ